MNKKSPTGKSGKKSLAPRNDSPKTLASREKQKILSALRKAKETTRELQLARRIESQNMYEQVTL